VAEKAKPKKTTITQKHVDNANEIAQLLAAHMASQQQQEPEQQTSAMPVGVSPLGGQAR
jgi:hypothetical protein